MFYILADLRVDEVDFEHFLKIESMRVDDQSEEVKARTKLLNYDTSIDKEDGHHVANVVYVYILT